MQSVNAAVRPLLGEQVFARLGRGLGEGFQVPPRPARSPQRRTPASTDFLAAHSARTPASEERTDAEKIQVLIAHSNALIATGLITALAVHHDIEVELQASSSQAAMQARRSGQQCVVITDYRSAMTGARLASASVEASEARWMTITGHGTECEIREALDSGMHGFLLSDCRLDEIVDAVRAVAKGGRYVCGRAAQRLIESQAREALSPREVAVMRLVIDGVGNKSIGITLGIALGTVKAHVKSILQKLNASSRTQAASLAAARGICGARLNEHQRQS